MNHTPITKIFTKDLVFSSSCEVKNISEHDGVKHDAVPVHLNVNTAFFVSGEAGTKTKEHSHHHPHWMVIQEGEIDFVSGSTTQRMSPGQWVYVPSAITHHMEYVSAAKVLCLHHLC
mmetsp:Transcript_6021/g.7406  ORF Transcript_6021/g.7406 Transcript_6021/m.7406 type:complete len:117 (-) Transcript_6021:37-387(-)